MTRGDLLTIGAAAALSVARPFVPTVGHSWPLVVMAASYIGAGVFLPLLRKERAPAWLPIGLPTLAIGLLLLIGAWVAAFLYAAHIFVGVMLCLLIQRRGRRSIAGAILAVLPFGWRWWPLGWVCLMVPALIELGMFLAHGI